MKDGKLSREDWLLFIALCGLVFLLVGALSARANDMVIDNSWNCDRTCNGPTIHLSSQWTGRHHVSLTDLSKLYLDSASSDRTCSRAEQEHNRM